MVCTVRSPGARLSKVPDSDDWVRKTVDVYLQDRGTNRFTDNMIKLSI